MNMCITYRNLLEAIETARRLQQEADLLSLSTDWYGTPEQRDKINALRRIAEAALDGDVREFYC